MPDVQNVVADIIHLDDGGDVGLVVAEPGQATDELFWATVLDNALEEDWRYGLDQDPTPVLTALTSPARKDESYVEYQVEAWLQRRYEQPHWLWWVRTPDPEADDGSWYLDPADETTPGAIFGALITPKRRDGRG